VIRDEEHGGEQTEVIRDEEHGGEQT